MCSLVTSENVSWPRLIWPTLYRRRIGKRTLVFKVMPFFDTEYLTNGYRYGHSYYKRRIGNRTQATGTSFNDIEMTYIVSSGTLNPTILYYYTILYYTSMTLTDLYRFQGHDIIQRQITRKRYNTAELWLQWRTNKKSYMVYRTAPFSMTLNDPKPRFQSQIIL